MNPDREGIAKVAVGITPSGTANAMTHALHRHPSRSRVSLVGRAALAVAKGLTCNVDVIHCHSLAEDANGAEKDVYALSCFGWGISGRAAAHQAACLGSKRRLSSHFPAFAVLEQAPLH
jgi:diacylglycerol kinase family enzyme